MNQQINYPELAHQLVKAGQRRPAGAVRILKTAAPQIAQQIVADGKRRGPLSFWGPCQNLDEFAGETIVAPEIIHAIGTLSGRRLSTRYPHAGLQHTYGLPVQHD